MTKEEIEQKYLAQHNALGSRKDAVDKKQFDIDHAKVWHDCELELLARKEALNAKGTLSDAEMIELRELRTAYPDPLPPSRDLAEEIDKLKTKVAKLEKAQPIR